jgi:hypothetical protein
MLSSTVSSSSPFPFKLFTPATPVKEQAPEKQKQNIINSNQQWVELIPPKNSTFEKEGNLRVDVNSNSKSQFLSDIENNKQTSR